MDTDYSCPFSQVHTLNDLLVLRLGLAGVKSLVKLLRVRSPPDPPVLCHYKKCHPSFRFAAPPVLRWHLWHTQPCQDPDPESCDQLTKEKFKLFLKWCTTGSCKVAKQSEWQKNTLYLEKQPLFIGFSFRVKTLNVRCYWIKPHSPVQPVWAIMFWVLELGFGSLL